jgi:DNA-binding response OmpR family regulator
MKRPGGTERHPETPITVLSVGPIDEDHDALSQILAAARWPLCPGSKWTLETCPGVERALSALKHRKAPLVICERDLGDATWRDFWAEAALLPEPPFLIVTSRLADEYLWAEALNLGAYDVLAKPFRPEEVVRALSQAWLRWAGPRPRKRTHAAIGYSRSAPLPGLAG